MKKRIRSARSGMRAIFHVLVQHRRPLIVIGQLALVALSTYMAFWLRFDGAIPEAELGLYYRTLPWLLAFRAAFFAGFRMNEGLWRYTSIWDLRNIIMGVMGSTTAFWIFVRWGLNYPNYPRSVFIIDALLLILMMGGIRLSRRIRHEFVRPKADRRVLIFGAGDAGEMLVRDMLKRGDGSYDPIGFIDDDPRKAGERIHGVRVLGSRAAMPGVIARLQPHEVVVAVPSLSPLIMRDIVTALEPFKVGITTLPTLSDIVDGKVSVTQVRSLSIEDLLPRAPVGLDVSRVRHLVERRCVLVTGAGGSIGSELCRQLAKLGPSELVLYERHENSLYAIASELQDAGYGAMIHPVMGDVTDRPRLDRTMADYAPALVFHAAAHKHVPLMELHVCEAVKNNVIGTRMVAEASVRHHVERFIMVSTDKAVEPSSVMGATKRVAELTVQAVAPGISTTFSTVRFGNVLGSSGSVVPRFQAQIRAGGPVTVTHPEMRRYFMLIPEAVQLVLQAAALEEQGRNIYVLDMGDQINLTDMARNLIRLSGFVPDEEIPIQFVGLRPGEKLSERLVGEDERVEVTPQDKILRVASLVPHDSSMFLTRLADLERLALEGDTAEVVRMLCEIVPSFTPTGVPEVVVASLSAKRAAPAYLQHVALTRTPAAHEYGDRRSGPPERRQMLRGGRRLSDRVRLASAGSRLTTGSAPSRQAGRMPPEQAARTMTSTPVAQS